MANPNLGLLIAMAQALGPLRERVVFVGGCATGLLMSQPALADIRPTEDVDAIVEVTTLAGYHLVTEELVARGFRQTMKTTHHHFGGFGSACNWIWCPWMRR
ncbi:hypothetical protein [Rhodoferax sp.]|uniref:hypothetical protein n=1 Tax=Rhodoferax sp. TaxID=50421 RepID=UPI0025E8217B|nr:hypothetical protein [Rhodoferax sp.]